MILPFIKAKLFAIIAIGWIAAWVIVAVQTWRLDNAQETIAEQRQLIVDVKAANLTQQATIEALRKANADWSNKCKADSEKWSSKLAEMVKQHQAEAEKLKAAPRIREVIYREVNDKCHAQPVPAAIAERLRN